MRKKIAILHRYPKDRIAETNAAFPYLEKKGMDVLTFKSFDRLSGARKFWKSVAWIFYAPCLVFGKGYEVIYCDDSYPFYPALVKMVSPGSKVIIRLGDFHLMYYFKGLTYSILHFFEKITWMLVDEIIAISQVMTNYIHEETGRWAYTVLDPVDTKRFKSENNGNNGSIMFHGVITKNKNIDILLEAAELLPEEIFVILGGGPDLKRLIDIAPPNVIFQGWVQHKDIPRHIDTCAVGVALRSENRGNEYVVTSPFLQYGAMGKPCLVTRRKVFGNYRWQFTTAKEMAEKIKELLALPEEGIALREHIHNNHDAEKIAEEIWFLLSS